MGEAVIISAARTAVGRFGGALRDVSDLDLGIAVVKAAMERAGITGEDVDEAIMGQSNRTGALPANPTRVICAMAGVPIEKPEFTINKHCGTSIRAVSLASQIIKAGDADCIIAGGVETMSRAAYLLPQARWGYRLGHGEIRDQLVLFDPICGLTMGQTAEKMAEEFKISRADQDEYACMSENRAERAQKEGYFKSQIVAIPIRGKTGESLFEQDETPRHGTTMESLSKLKPVFKEGGTVTAGNSSKMNDGAGAIVVMSEEKAKRMGRKPMARIMGYASAGVEPAFMGLGPVPATRAALKKTGLSLDDIDLVELNEAFAVQALKCIRDLGLDIEKTNVNGGAVALGHPIAATGSVIFTKLLYELERQKKRLGLATMCIGGGQGIALIVERVE